MKKSLIAIFLVTVMILPLFAADKGTKEINIKAGLNINPSATVAADGIVSGLDVKLPFSLDGGAVVDGNMQYRLAAEGYYFVKDGLGVGLGVERAFPTGYINEILARADSVNIYAAVKQEIKISENKFIDGIYLLGRLGYGINNLKSDLSEILSKVESAKIDVSADNGLYWALGMGFEKNNFLIEILYSVNYSKLNVDIDKINISTDLSLSTIGINVGYKFTI